jgi:predicted phage-related endonuclease
MSNTQGNPSLIVPSLRDQWLARRKTGIGSSDSPVLYLGEVFGRTALDVYVDKCTPHKPEGEVEETNDNFRRGNVYEPLAIQEFVRTSGVQVSAPCNYQERFGDGSIFHSRHSEGVLYADYDGICEDGWLVEVKAPRQMKADKMRNEGVENYYLVQTAHQAAVAADQGTYLWPAAAFKGVRLLIWEPERAVVQVVELPYNIEFAQMVRAKSEAFWHEHIDPRVPPTRAKHAQPVLPPKPKGKDSPYKPVEGDAWREAGGMWRLAKDMEATAKARVERVKKEISGAMRELGLTHVLLPDATKFIAREVPGRVTLDEAALRAAHPEIDLDRFRKQGKPFFDFRAYGPKDSGEDALDSLDEAMSSVVAELEALPTRNLDLEVLMPAWEETRARADMYARLLRNEATTLDGALDRAAAAMAARLTR